MTFVRKGKYQTVVGCMLLIMPGGIDWYWGNLSVYAMSLVVSVDDISQERSPTIVSLHSFFYASGIVVTGLTVRFLSEKWLMLIGSLVLNGAFLWSYYAIQFSYVMLKISLGVCVAFGQGVLFGNAVQIVIQSTDKDTGLLTSLLPSSFSMGALINSLLISLYINPRNEATNLKVGVNDYFTQKDIIQKVPSMFLMLLVFTIIMHSLGIFLLQFNPNISFMNFARTKQEEICLYDKEALPKKIGAKSECSKRSVFSMDLLSEESKWKSYTLAEAVKTPKFYSICASVVSSSFSIVILVSIYKSFGELWIDDDHLMSGIGGIFLLSSSISRIVLGLALDKFGLRNCVMTLLSAIAIALPWYYFTVRINQWLYFFTTIILGSCVGSIKSSHLATTAVVFGKAHVAANFGSFLFIAAVFEITAPTILDLIIRDITWCALFSAASGLNIISLVLCLHYTPDPSQRVRNNSS